MESGQKDRRLGCEGKAECSGSQSQFWSLEPCDVSKLNAFSLTLWSLSVQILLLLSTLQKL